MGNGKYPNRTVQLLTERGSCRNFSDQQIPPDIMQYILEAGTHSASGGNLQPYSIIKIEKDETKQRLAELGGQGFIAESPVILLFCIDWHRIERWAALETAPFTATSSFRHFWISFQDTVICAQNICTAADSLGLGSVYIGTVTEFFTDLRDMFQLPKGVFPVVLLCVGYPKARPLPRKKLGIEVVVHSERYREMEDGELMKAFDEKYEGRKLETTGEMLKEISSVCREVGGEEFARNCIGRIRDKGYINPAQYLFGLHYSANLTPQGNDTYLQLMEEFGFNWFKEYRPFEEGAT